MTTLIQRNTTIPTRKSEPSRRQLTTNERRSHVLQGERPLARDNRTLAGSISSGAARAARIPQVEVTFDPTPTGIVNVSARTGDGQEQKITITASSGLGKTKSSG